MLFILLYTSFAISCSLMWPKSPLPGIFSSTSQTGPLLTRMRLHMSIQFCSSLVTLSTFLTFVVFLVRIVLNRVLLQIRHISKALIAKLTKESGKAWFVTPIYVIIDPLSSLHLFATNVTYKHRIWLMFLHVFLQIHRLDPTFRTKRLNSFMFSENVHFEIDFDGVLTTTVVTNVFVGAFMVSQLGELNEGERAVGTGEPILRFPFIGSSCRDFP